MKIIQFYKKLNNTELGKAGTHETYIHVPQGIDLTDIFKEIGKEYIFIDKEDGDSYNIRLTSARENRIVGLGIYYRKKDLCAGDIICVESVESDNVTQLFISSLKVNSCLVFKKSRQLFEILTESNIENVNEKYKDKLEIRFMLAQKRRADSDETNHYDILVDGRSILDDYKNNEYGELIPLGDTCIIEKFFGHRKVIVETEV